MSIDSNLQHTLQNIIAAERQYARKPGSVKLLAVSKAQSIAAIQAAIAAGQLDFGENYVQEAVDKMTALASVNKSLTWHFIGAIQSNKTKMIAQHFAWVHSVASLAHAERLNAQRLSHLPLLNICIQVNVDEELSKGGIALKEISALAHAVVKLPRLRLRGLMAVPAPRGEFALQREAFHKLNSAFNQLQQAGLPVDTLSMGMSNDYVAAIAEGATIVRIGTAIFGVRK